MALAPPESMGNMGVRLATEQVYGALSGSPTWRRLNDVKMIPKPAFETDMFMASGFEVPSEAILNDDFTNVDVSGRLSYTSLMFILSSLFGYPTSTLVSGSTYDHVWEWDGKTPILPASYSMDYGTAARARRVLGVVFNNFSAGVTRGGLEFGSGAFGKDLNLVPAMGGMTNEVQTIAITGAPTGGTFTLSFRGQTTAPIAYNATAAAVLAALEALPTIGPGGVTVTGGPLPGTAVVVTFVGRLGGQDVPTITHAASLTGGTTPAVSVTTTTQGVDTAVDVISRPMFPLHFDIFAGDTWAEATAGSTQFVALYNYGLGVGDRLERSRPVKSNRSTDNIYLREEQEHTIDLRLGADATAEGFISTIRAGSKKFIRAQAIGPATGDAALKYEFESQTTILLGGTEGYDTENGIHVMTWNGRIGYDAVTGRAARFRLRNKIASL